MRAINPGLALAWRSRRVRGIMIAVWNDDPDADVQEEAEELRSHVVVKVKGYYATVAESDWTQLNDEDKIRLVCEAGEAIGDGVDAMGHRWHP